MLARMTMQKLKIIYGEDVATIYQERGEVWSHMALEAGHRYVIAVPIILLEQPIGVFILYDDKPHYVTRRDTFLLSTAAIDKASGPTCTSPTRNESEVCNGCRPWACRQQQAHVPTSTSKRRMTVIRTMSSWY